MNKINNLLGITESYKAPERLMQILTSGDYKSLFLQFLTEFDYDVSYDWFHDYFQDEHADRAVKKQDFTPNSISRLVAEMIGLSDGVLREPAAGTGGMIIQAWCKQRRNYSPFDYDPLSFFVVAEEKSERALPFLLFNLMIRGINGNVILGDTLKGDPEKVYFVFNESRDHLSFSRLYEQPRDAGLAGALGVNFV